jgi:uncharacterized paraquat-inducible protein A
MDIIIYLLIAITVGAALGYGAIQFSRARSSVKDEPMFHFNCPKCKRRFSYRARQSGHKGACPRCGQHLVFPAIAPAVKGAR